MDTCSCRWKHQQSTGIVDIDIPDDLIKQCDDPIPTIVKEVYGGNFGGRSDQNFSYK